MGSRIQSKPVYDLHFIPCLHDIRFRILTHSVYIGTYFTGQRERISNGYLITVISITLFNRFPCNMRNEQCLYSTEHAYGCTYR